MSVWYTSYPKNTECEILIQNSSWKLFQGLSSKSKLILNLFFLNIRLFFLAVRQNHSGLQAGLLRGRQLDLQARDLIRHLRSSWWEQQRLRELGQISQEDKGCLLLAWELFLQWTSCSWTWLSCTAALSPCGALTATILHGLITYTDSLPRKC